jgi:hypothetical protein
MALNRVFQPEQRSSRKQSILPVIAGEVRRKDRTKKAQEAPMTKTTLTLAAALLAGTTLTSAANAGGIRVGFGFPLGSFIAHSNQSYSGGGYGHRNCNHRHHAARPRHRPTTVAKAKRKPKVEVASKPVKQVVKTAKLEDKLVTDDSTTTEIAKTPATTNNETKPAETTNTTTTSSIEKTTEDSSGSASTSTETEAPKVEQTASVETSSTDKTETKKISVPAKIKHVCRRFSAAVAGLVDVPCQ